MLIVIPGALPALPVAADLAQRLPHCAPTLYTWLQQASAQRVSHDIRAQGCTAFEAWQLERAAYQPEPGLLLSAGLGPLIAGPVADDAPVWLAELAHLALGADQAMLSDPEQLDLRADESSALMQAALPLFEEAGFTLAPLGSTRWRVGLPDGLRPQTASPFAVCGQRLNTWWSQDAASRPWRRLLNTIQMTWHAHPVNDARLARHAVPINALWLYGGARPWPQPQPQSVTLFESLQSAHRAEDWAAWLDALATLDTRDLRPLAGPQGLPQASIELLLLGRDRRVTLTLSARPRLLRWLPRPTQNWSHWWSHPV